MSATLDAAAQTWRKKSMDPDMVQVLDALAAVPGLDLEDLARFRQLSKPYRGRRSPEHIGRRKRGSCFTTADELEEAGHGRRVRGFAVSPLTPLPVGHAWITTTGYDAVDAVWSLFATDSFYVGIEGRGHERLLDRMTTACTQQGFPWAWRGLF